MKVCVWGRVELTRDRMQTPVAAQSWWKAHRSVPFLLTPGTAKAALTAGELPGSYGSFCWQDTFQKMQCAALLTYVSLLSWCTLRSHITLRRSGKNWMSLIYILNNAFRCWNFFPFLQCRIQLPAAILFKS